MPLTTLYVISVILFLTLDYLGLTYLIKPLFERHLGDWLLDTPRYGPALAFYLFYIAGLLWFVSAPALRDETPLLTVFLLGAFFGAIGYGTYEFSNMATLRNWTWTMLVTDLAWGTLLTGSVAVGGVSLTRAFG